MRNHVRRLAAGAVLGVLALLIPVPASAQFGVGARLTWVTADSEVVDAAKVRFVGGQVRLGMSPRLGFEVSLDSHCEDLETLNQKVTERPLQVSLLMKLARGSVQPYLLGGPGWYKRSVEPLTGAAEDVRVTTTEFGWHAGGGLELRLGGHIGIHGDYRYTFLSFGNDNDIGGGVIPGVGNLLPGHRGSMWTLGTTVYF